MKFSSVRLLVKDYEKNFKCLRINKLVFSFLTAVIFMFSVSCRTVSSSSPSYVATKIGNALLEGDMEAVLTHIFIGDEFTVKFKGISFSMPIKLEIEKESVDLPIAKFKILSEKISKDGQKAVVTVKAIFKDKSSQVIETNFVKTDEGWKAKLIAE